MPTANQPPAYLTKAEVKAILAETTTDRDHLLLIVLFATGGRITEVLHLTPRDVKDDSLYLMTEKQSKRPLREVVVPPEVADLVRGYVAEHRILPNEPIFKGRKGQLTRQAAWYMMKKCASAAGIERVRDGRLSYAWPHLLRHSAAMDWKKHIKRNPLEFVQQQLGHADIRSTMRYGRMSVDDRRESLAEADGR